MGGANDDAALAIAVDANGFFQDTVGFDPGPDTKNLIAVGYDIFVSKLNASGDFVWQNNFPEIIMKLDLCSC